MFYFSFIPIFAGSLNWFSKWSNHYNFFLLSVVLFSGSEYRLNILSWVKGWQSPNSSCLCSIFAPPSLAVWSWAYNLTSLSFVCKMRDKGAHLIVSLWKLGKNIHVKTLILEKDAMIIMCYYTQMLYYREYIKACQKLLYNNSMYFYQMYHVNISS